MRSGPLELQPAREFVQRMHELESELQRARQAQRRLKANPDIASGWGLETRAPLQQEEGWFLTYLDMMTLLLVAMIVMLAFSGSLARREQTPTVTATAPAVALATPETGLADSLPPPPVLPAAAVNRADDIPAPDAAFPYPAAPAAAFEQSGYPSDAVAALASAYPTPMDLAPKPAPEPPAPAATPEPEEPQAAPATVALAPHTAETPPATAVAAAAAAPATSAPAVAAVTPMPSPAAAAPHSAPTPAPEVLQATAAAPAPETAQAVSSTAPAEIPDHSQSEGESLAAALPLDELGSEVEVIVNQRSVSLRINNEILFGTGQADLSQHGLAVLKRMAEVLSKDGYDIVVEGHTDSVPVRNNGRYPSNWELSTARAGSVVRYLQANGIDKAHLKAVGYADTRPIAGNRDADGRARNRRVELVIEKPDPKPPQTSGQAGAAGATPPSGSGRAG